MRAPKRVYLSVCARRGERTIAHWTQQTCSAHASNLYAAPTRRAQSTQLASGLTRPSASVGGSGCAPCALQRGGGAVPSAATERVRGGVMLPRKCQL